jgi:serine/threonine protein kinase
MNRTQVGPYRLIRLLGAGGFGEVYEASHQLLQQKRAIKLLLEHHLHDPNQRERFLREARTLATLEHPNILPILEVGEEDDVLYLVMPFYRRGTLNDLLKQRTTLLSLAEVERCLMQICAAVDHAHSRNIAHLDLKPDNMLLHEDGRLVLSDFGLAHLVKQGRLEAGSSASWGTPHYMAPEQILGKPELRSDLYALGVILYQLLTNQRPFTGATPEAVMMKHLLEASPPLRAVIPGILSTLESVIQKALQKRPKDRYQIAQELLDDFRVAVSASSSAQSLTPSTQPIPRSASVLPALNSVPLNKMQTTSAVCEISNCGVQAVGRCSTCGSAFCGSHRYQAKDGWGMTSDEVFYLPQVDYFNICALCFKVLRAKAVGLANEANAAEEYLRSGALRTDLINAGVPTAAIHWVEKRQEIKKSFFSSRFVEVEEIVNCRGWILGEFSWCVHGSYEDCLTALLDASLEDLRFIPDENVKRRSYFGLVRVHGEAENYEALFDISDWAELLGSWGSLDATSKEESRKVMHAVKRLTGA